MSSPDHAKETAAERLCGPDHATFRLERGGYSDGSTPEQRLAEGKRANAKFQFIRHFHRQPTPDDAKLLKWVAENYMPELTSAIDWPTAIAQLKALEQQ